MKLIIDISEEVYKKAKETPDLMCGVVWRGVKYGTPLDDVKAEIERLKHQYTDVSGYRWWNNAIDNCLNIIRDRK